MADFEGLIRQALARQDASDPAIRDKVYQSSRNALARMIASSGAQSPDAINQHREALENSIRRIEADYAAVDAQPEPTQRPPDPPPPPPTIEPAMPMGEPAVPSGEPAVPTGEPAVPSADQPEIRGEALPDRQGAAPQQAAAEPWLSQQGGEFPAVSAGDAPNYPRPRRRGARLFTLAAFLVLLLVVGWLLYTLAETLSPGDGEIQTSGGNGGSQTAESSDTDENGTQITVLSPVSTGTLVTAGRGRAEIVNQGNTDYIRLVSLRPDGDRETTAEPILLQIEPGVLEQIAGKRVTVELRAKSGEVGPANFAVGCRFAGDDVCGRKRFRIGLQPEATVFTMNVPANIGAGDEAHLTINTDVSAEAAITGEGAAVDILYTRLRLSDG